MKSDREMNEELLEKPLKLQIRNYLYSKLGAASGESEKYAQDITNIVLQTLKLIK